MHASVPIAMSQPRSLHCYEYIDRPYGKVRELLHSDPLKLLQRATTSAAARTNSLVAKLHVQVAGIEIGVDVRVLVRRIRDQKGASGDAEVTRLELSWEAELLPALFPAMLAEVSARPLSANETQIDVDGSYWPPLGPVGNAIDAAGGHRIAEATVHRFLIDLVEQMRQ
jgi:hypothetical protein